MAKDKQYQIDGESEDSHIIHLKHQVKVNYDENYDYYMKMSSNEKIICTYFISQNSQYPNCELSENIESYIWVNDDCFVYSVENKGIYYYDLRNQVKGVVTTGTGKFEIKSYENNILKYQDSEIEWKI